MNTIEELRKRVEVLEALLKEEKKFRDTMNKYLQWEKERNKIECSALRKSLCKYISLSRDYLKDAEEAREELLKLQTKYRDLQRKHEA